MFRKSLTLLAVLGVLMAVRVEETSAQQLLLPAPVLAQLDVTQLVCLAPAQGAAAAAQGITIQSILQRLNLTYGQLVGTPCLALVNGRYVWQIWVNTGGGPTRRVVDALTGVVVPGL